jgi:HJR/Mrr/RecB family endonuclease
MSANSITQRLLRAETDLLHAIPLGDAAVTAFTTSWEALEGDITRMAPQLCNETLQLVNAVSSRVALIAEQFEELRSESSALEADAIERFEAIRLQHQPTHGAKYVSTNFIAMLG